MIKRRAALSHLVLRRQLHSVEVRNGTGDRAVVRAWPVVNTLVLLDWAAQVRRFPPGVARHVEEDISHLSLRISLPPYSHATKCRMQNWWSACSSARDRVPGYGEVPGGLACERGLRSGMGCAARA